MKKLIILLFLVLYSSVCFAITLGVDFIAIREREGKVVIIEKSQIIPIVSKDGLSVGIYHNSRNKKGVLMHIDTIEFKTRIGTTTWLKENFEPRCMTRKTYDKNCDPIDAPVLNDD